MSCRSEGSEPAINVGTESDDAMPIIDVKIESPIQNHIDWNNPPLFKPSKVHVKEYWEFVTLTLLKMIL